MYTLVNPSFTISKSGVRGSTLHGYVSMIDSFRPLKLGYMALKWCGCSPVGMWKDGGLTLTTRSLAQSK